MNVSDFLERLEGVKKAANGWDARCPAHDDKRPSLGVLEGADGRIVLRCRAGCETTAVLAELGLEISDLFPETEQRNGRREVCAYPHHDEAGSVLFEVVRFDPKDFRQRRPDGSGGWIWNTQGVRRVLYHLPAVVEAVAAGGVVWVCEGEKDADALQPLLAAIGGAATSNPGGAGKWKPEHTEQLRGARVVVVADKDEPGRKHARAIEAALSGVAASVDVVEAASGKDAADHVAAGLGLGEFVQATAAAEPHAVETASSPVVDAPLIVSLEEFAAVEEMGAAAIVGSPGEAVIPEGGDVLIYGDGGAGKTTLMIDLGCHLAAGDDWIGMPIPNAVRVLLVENEGPRPLFRAKLRRKLGGWAGAPLAGRVQVLERPWAWFTFADESRRAWLAGELQRLEIDVVIIGPVSRSGMQEAGTLAEVRDFMALVDDVRRRTGRHVTFILVHHENKGGKVSGAWEGSGDTLLHVTGQGHGHTRVYVQKARWASSYHAQTIVLAWTPGEGFEVEDRPEFTDEEVGDQIVTAIAADPGAGWTKVEEATPGMSKQKRRQARDGLLRGGVIVNIGREAGADVWLEECPERKQARLYLASDPTIQHLRPDPGADGAQSAPATGVDIDRHLRPAPRLKGAQGGAVADPPPDDSLWRVDR